MVESAREWDYLLAPFGMGTSPRGRSLRRHQARSRTGCVSVLHNCNCFFSLFTDCWFYSVFSQSVSDFDLCALLQYVLLNKCM